MTGTIEAGIYTNERSDLTSRQKRERERGRNQTMHETLKESECLGRTSDLDMWNERMAVVVTNKECVVWGENETEGSATKKERWNDNGVGGVLLFEDEKEINHEQSVTRNLQRRH